MNNFYSIPEEPKKPYKHYPDCPLRDPRESWQETFSFGTCPEFSMDWLLSKAPPNLDLSSLKFEITTTRSRYSDYDDGTDVFVSGLVKGATEEQIKEYEEAYKKAEEMAENHYQIMMKQYHLDMKKYKIDLANHNKWLAECEIKKANSAFAKAEQELAKILKEQNA